MSGACILPVLLYSSVNKYQVELSYEEEIFTWAFDHY